MQTACALRGQAVAEVVLHGCDASKLAAAGIPSIIFGPGDIAQAHTKDEFIALADLEAGTAAYTDLTLKRYTEMLTEESRHHDFRLGRHGLSEHRRREHSAGERARGTGAIRARQGPMRGRAAQRVHGSLLRSRRAHGRSANGGSASPCSCSSEAYNLLANALHLGADDEVVITDLISPVPPRGSTPRSHRKLACGRRVTARWTPMISRPCLTNARASQVSPVSFYNGHRLDWSPFIETVRAHAPQAIVAVDVTRHSAVWSWTVPISTFSFPARTSGPRRAWRLCGRYPGECENGAT